MIVISTRPTCGIFLPRIVRDERLVPRVGPIGCEVPDEAAVLGIRFEHDLRAARPALEHVRAGADRVRHRVVAVALRSLRARRRRARCARRRRGSCSRSPSGGSAACSGRRPPCRGSSRRSRTCRVFFALRGELVQADDLAFEQERVRRAVLRIHEPHVRVDEVLRDELALLALERRIGREVDALA